MKKSIFIAITLILTMLFGVAKTVSAQITNPAIGELGGVNADGTVNLDPGKAYDNAIKGQTLLAQFVRLWANAMTIGALLVIFYFLFGAIEWITSAGDTGKLDKARQKMMHAAIGMIILVSSFIILGFVSGLLFGKDFDLLNLQFFTPGSN